MTFKSVYKSSVDPGNTFFRVSFIRLLYARARTCILIRSAAISAMLIKESYRQLSVSVGAHSIAYTNLLLSIQLENRSHRVLVPVLICKTVRYVTRWTWKIRLKLIVATVTVMLPWSKSTGSQVLPKHEIEYWIPASSEHIGGRWGKFFLNAITLKGSISSASVTNGFVDSHDCGRRPAGN